MASQQPPSEQPRMKLPVWHHLPFPFLWQSMTAALDLSKHAASRVDLRGGWNPILCEGLRAHGGSLRWLTIGG